MSSTPQPHTFAPARTGPFTWLLQAINRWLASAVAKPPAVITDEPEVQTWGTTSYVVAPGGYRIRVPKVDDVQNSIGTMIPSVRRGLDLIPPLPHVVSQLLREIQDPQATAATVAEIASSDPALAASLIRTVNSAAFALQRKITSVTEAVNYIGFSSVKAMVIRLQLDQALGGKIQTDPDAEDLWIHCLLVSYIADVLAKNVPGVDRGFVTTLGLLHDIGKLIVRTQFPSEAVQLQGRPTDESSMEREVRVLGVDHAALGANLAAKWGLPGDLVQAIRFHHHPEQAFMATDPRPLHQAVCVVQLANQLSKYLYVYQDDTEIDAIADSAFELLGLPANLTALLTPEVRATATRAIFFADEASRRSVTEVRRFLRFNHGQAAADLLASVAQTASASQVEVEDVLCESLFTEEPVKDPVRRLRLAGPTNETGIRDLCNDVKKRLEKLPLSVETRTSMSLIARYVLANVVSGGGQGVDVAFAVDNKTVGMAIRSPMLSFARRFGPECDPDAALAALDCELANVLNLGWCDSIGASTDGATLLFRAKSA